jgi:hypothetical protein
LALGAGAGLSAVLSLPVLLPIYYKWIGGSGDLTVVVAIRGGAWAIVGVMAAGAFARSLIELRSRRQIGGLTALAPARVASTPVRVVRLLLASLFATLLLAAIMETYVDAAIVFGALATAFLLRAEILPRLPLYVRVVGRFPILLRILLTMAAGYGIGLVAMASPAGFLADAYLPFVISLALSTIVAAFLLPNPAVGAEHRVQQPREAAVLPAGPGT